MRNPKRSRNAGLLILFLGGAALAPAVFTGEAPANAIGILALAGGVAAAVGLCWALFSQVEVARASRLDRGEGVIARWSVPPALWRDFLALNERLNAAPGAVECHMDARPGQDGAIGVVIAEAALRIGGDFHSLPTGGSVHVAGPYWVQGPPGCLEFQLTTHTNDHSRKVQWALRVPVPPGAEAQAERIHAIYAARSSAKPRP